MSNNKISKAKGQAPTELENQVARALLDLEITSKDLSADLRDLYITAAKEVDVSGDKKAIVVFVPFRQHKKFQVVQSRLVRELEKKFSSKHVVFVAQRTIQSKNHSRQSNGELRARSRTLTAVYDAIVEDVVYPTQIVGRRTRVRQDGSKLVKLYLDPKDVKEVDQKLKTYSAVIQKLTSRNVEFLFPL